LAIVGAHAENLARDTLPADSSAVVREPGQAATVLSGQPGVIAAGVARLLFKSAPLVVVADPGTPADLSRAALLARRTHAPLLLAAPARGDAQASALRAAVKALRPQLVLAVGVGPGVLSAELPKRTRVITDPADLPPGLKKVRLGPAPLRTVALLVHSGGADGPAGTAARVTAHAAGARIVLVRGYDPGTDPAAIVALASAKPRRVVAIGASFGSDARLATRVAVAETGMQLPGGGQVLFPDRVIVALYGHPYAAALGVLGEQDLAASIARARKMAAPYRSLTKVPVIPAFEIIATVAEASAGPCGCYSYETPVSQLLPWVRKATAAGMYVILDLQPGRDNLLAQAKVYKSLLKLPNVGLALDPEWKLQPGQLPLQQIGSVSIGEVNSVVTWLARLTSRYHLPQKLLELHEFRLTMIQNVQQLDTRHTDLSIVINMDGQGTQGDKQQTWDAVVGNAPRGVYFGWKNFLVKDHPMATPGQTMARTPVPVLISYE
jgi:hypothetical protein